MMKLRILSDDEKDAREQLLELCKKIVFEFAESRKVWAWCHIHQAQQINQKRDTQTN